MSFQDHFSAQAKLYAQYRPHYPVELYQYLSSLCSTHQTAWDCATGNGQAAVALADYFERVIATDPSASQISNATQKTNVEYRVETAEETSIPDASIDLITVAQAYHWFDIPTFAQQVKRVLKPQGMIAVWCYNLFRVDDAIDALADHLYSDITGPYWPKGRHFIDEKYLTIAFPFATIQTPTFHMQAQWNLTELLGYLQTWSGVQYYLQENQVNPVLELMPDFEKAWGDATVSKTVRWEIFLRVGRC